MTLLLTRADIARLMQPSDYLDAVQSAFVASRSGLATAPVPMHLEGIAGGFHAKGATLARAHPYAAIKLNANFPDNPARGMPTIQGVIALFDAKDGALLALMDSIEITLRRTAAATALAARHFARHEVVTVTICGCGGQALAQLQALAQVTAIARVFGFDVDEEKARRFAEAASRADVSVTPVGDLGRATRESDLIVTCTTARSPFLDIEHVAPGTFVAALGADNPEKNEISPALMARAKVVVDALDQCATMGDLHHAIEAGVMTRADVYASLAEVVAGEATACPGPADIVIFDSTGTALQDVASAALAFERAQTVGLGGAIELASHEGFNA